MNGFLDIMLSAMESPDFHTIVGFAIGASITTLVFLWLASGSTETDKRD